MGRHGGAWPERKRTRRTSEMFDERIVRATAVRPSVPAKTHQTRMALHVFGTRHQPVVGGARAPDTTTEGNRERRLMSRRTVDKYPAAEQHRTRFLRLRASAPERSGSRLRKNIGEHTECENARA